MSRVPRHSCRGTLGARRSPVRRLRQRKRRVAARPHVPSPGPHLHARRSCRSTQQCGFPNPEDHRQLLEVPSGRMRSSTSARSSRQQNPRLSGGALALRMPSAPDQTLHLAKSVPFARAPRLVTYRNAIATCDATGAGSRRRSPAADSHRDAGSATRVGCCASPDRRAVAGGPADGSAIDGMVSGDRHRGYVHAISIPVALGRLPDALPAFGWLGHVNGPVSPSAPPRRRRPRRCRPLASAPQHGQHSPLMVAGELLAPTRARKRRADLTPWGCQPERHEVTCTSSPT